MQNTSIKKDNKSIHRNSLNETNMFHISFTQSTWALTGCSCFGFSFEFSESSVSSLSD